MGLQIVTIIVLAQRELHLNYEFVTSLFITKTHSENDNI